jgi:hypothetical protein
MEDNTMNLLRRPEVIQAELDQLEREWDQHDAHGRLTERAEVAEKMNTLANELDLAKGYYHGTKESSDSKV